MGFLGSLLKIVFVLVLVVCAVAAGIYFLKFVGDYYNASQEAANNMTQTFVYRSYAFLEKIVST